MVIIEEEEEGEDSGQEEEIVASSVGTATRVGIGKKVASRRRRQRKLELRDWREEVEIVRRGKRRLLVPLMPQSKL